VTTLLVFVSRGAILSSSSTSFDNPSCLLIFRAFFRCSSLNPGLMCGVRLLSMKFRGSFAYFPMICPIVTFASSTVSCIAQSVVRVISSPFFSEMCGSTSSIAARVVRISCAI